MSMHDGISRDFPSGVNNSLRATERLAQVQSAPHHRVAAPAILRPCLSAPYPSVSRHVWPRCCPHRQQWRSSSAARVAIPCIAFRRSRASKVRRITAHCSRSRKDAAAVANGALAAALDAGKRTCAVKVVQLTIVSHDQPRSAVVNRECPSGEACGTGCLSLRLTPTSCVPQAPPTGIRSTRRGSPRSTVNSHQVEACGAGCVSLRSTVPRAKGARSSAWTRFSVGGDATRCSIARAVRARRARVSAQESSRCPGLRCRPR